MRSTNMRKLVVGLCGPMCVSGMLMGVSTAAVADHHSVEINIDKNGAADKNGVAEEHAHTHATSKTGIHIHDGVIIDVTEEHTHTHTHAASKSGIHIHDVESVTEEHTHTHTHAAPEQGIKVKGKSQSIPLWCDCDCRVR